MPPPSPLGFAGFRLFAQVRSVTNGVNGSSVPGPEAAGRFSVTTLPCSGFRFLKGFRARYCSFRLIPSLEKKKSML